MSICEHPSRSRYNSGCHCDGCRASNTEYEKRRTRLRAYGTPTDFTNAGPARAHVKRLVAQGHSLKEISRVTGVGHSSLGQLMRKSYKTGKKLRYYSRKNANALFAFEGRALLDGQLISRESFDYMVVALMRLGWPVRALAAETGINYQVLYAVGLDFVTVRSSRALIAWMRKTKGDIEPCLTSRQMRASKDAMKRAVKLKLMLDQKYQKAEEQK